MSARRLRVGVLTGLTLVCGLTISSCGGPEPRPYRGDGAVVPLRFKDGIQLDAELALSREAHRRGLMHRTEENLPRDRGMIFIFQSMSGKF